GSTQTNQAGGPTGRASEGEPTGRQQERAISGDSRCESLMTEASPERSQMGSLIRSPLDFAGGLFLIGIDAVGYIGGFSLPFGQLSGIGSGLMPRVVAVLVAAFGIVLILQSFVS